MEVDENFTENESLKALLGRETQRVGRQKVKNQEGGTFPACSSFGEDEDDEGREALPHSGESG